MSKKEPSHKMPVNVPRDVHDALNEFLDEAGRVKQVLIGDILTWWMRQPEAVRKVASMDVTEGVEKAYAVALRSIADDVERGIIPIPQSKPARTKSKLRLRPPGKQKPQESQ